MQVYVLKSKKPDTSFLPRDKNGKPLPLTLANGRRLHFNISHSGEYFAIALDKNPVGIDLQTRRQLSERILKKILSPGEKPVKNNYLHNFVIKEAYSKLSGEGLSIGFSDFDANDLIKKYHPYHEETDDYILYAFSQNSQSNQDEQSN